MKGLKGGRERMTVQAVSELLVQAGRGAEVTVRCGAVDYLGEKILSMEPRDDVQEVTLVSGRMRRENGQWIFSERGETGRNQNLPLLAIEKIERPA